LEGRFSHLLLDIYKLDAALGGPLVVVNYDKVVAIIGHLVIVSQELLLVTKVNLERIGLLLKVKPPCSAHCHGIEAA
jgi:hypothetical protein